MKIVFSRKGFDSASGGGPSPIVDGAPVSLPIPAMLRDGAPVSRTTYGDLGLGEAVTKASRGKLGASDFAHHDPMFTGGECLFGQVGTAQSHLANRGVGVGDVFLFFGLFQKAGCTPHHRIFGFLKVEQKISLADCPPEILAELKAHRHPHALAMHGTNDCIYRGPGRIAVNACDVLRLSVPDGQGSPSLWNRPEWLKPDGLSYHDRADRWLHGRRLQSVARGQEFVADVGQREAPRRWLDDVIAAINNP
ncbi:hypothetical protein HME9302_01946 [Alteripontixanthobacter maritimus]|uniref:Nucleotide modification associated domain-containing protein n=1 Tax=Alteripontixanthobacter maritimus TaxID=2161824 RepID=A0A369Q8Q9_9SPHN|nr:hypothetical protein [Alteripontixanthobacter maritimus]RDC60730.1 hypothetical protein HME9302_01946 [Alteripontixanthobacter maritimus]